MRFKAAMPSVQICLPEQNKNLEGNTIVKANFTIKNDVNHQI
jgi:hypothetical protein